MLDYIYSISPIDGRYSEMTKEVGNYFSEYYLIKNRIIVEIEWLKKLAKIEELNIQLTTKELEILNKIIEGIDLKQVKRVKEIEYKRNYR